MIKLAIGEERARETPISSTKGATGHSLGAVRRGRGDLHDARRPARTSAADDQLRGRSTPTCDLDYIPNESREVKDMRYGVSNSFGFGGHNASIVVGKWTE